MSQARRSAERAQEDAILTGSVTVQPQTRIPHLH